MIIDDRLFCLYEAKLPLSTHYSVEKSVSKSFTQNYKLQKIGNVAVSEVKCLKFTIYKFQFQPSAAEK